MSPSDSRWPAHPNKHWNEVLDYARRRGWTLTPHTSHSFGTLRCQSGGCTILIFSTGRGAESVARSARKKIDKCPHVSGDNHWSMRVEIALDRAEHLLRAAEALVQRDNADAESYILAAPSASDAESRIAELIDEIERWEGVAARELEQGDADPQVNDAWEAANLANEELTHARAALSESPPATPQVRSLRDRLRRLQRNLHEVREAARRQRPHQ